MKVFINYISIIGGEKGQPCSDVSIRYIIILKCLLNVSLLVLFVRLGCDLAVICLNDQANNCLIHFYKRCVSQLVSPGSPGLMISEGLNDSPLKHRDYIMSRVSETEKILSVKKVPFFLT